MTTHSPQPRRTRSSALAPPRSPLSSIPLLSPGITGAKTGANVLRPRSAQRDPPGAFTQVRRSGPRSGFAQIRAYPLTLLRDEEAAGSNPATPTK